jgi:Mn-dependent DtxR family transcriptional regulator
MKKADRQKQIYKYYTGYLFEHGKAPMSSDVAREFGFSREYARQVLESMVKDGYMIKVDRHRARYMPNIVEKIKVVKNGKNIN